MYVMMLLQVWRLHPVRSNNGFEIGDMNGPFHQLVGFARGNDTMGRASCRRQNYSSSGRLDSIEHDNEIAKRHGKKDS
jgi:hypothetical protein